MHTDGDGGEPSVGSTPGPEPAAGGSGSHPTRRDASKARTRQALIDAALTLFSTNGYDHTTAEAIADHAGVTSRTFFRHFATKESILFFGEDQFYRSFAETLDAQDRSLPELRAISASFIAGVPMLEPHRERHRQYRMATAMSSTLRGQEQYHLDAHIALIARGIARRRGLTRPDDSCRVVAAISTTTAELAIGDWALASAGPPLATVIADRFRVLEDLRSGGATGATGAIARSEAIPAPAGAQAR